jgi:hypothetical protein
MEIIMSLLPGWDSLDDVSYWHNFFNIAGIICLAFLVGTEAIAQFYGHREKYLTGIAEAARTADQKTKEDEAEARRKAEVEGLQKQLSEADKKVSGLQSQNVARRLKPDQKTALIGALSPFAGQKVFIWCSTAAWDGTAFATDFLETFKQAKWEPTDQIRYGIVVGADAVGIEVLVNPQMANAAGQVLMPSVVTLVETLVRLNLMPAPSLGRMPEIEPGTIYFRIGRFPPPK